MVYYNVCKVFGSVWIVNNDFLLPKPIYNCFNKINFHFFTFGICFVCNFEIIFLEMKKLGFILFIILIPAILFSQEKIDQKRIVAAAKIIDGDTVPYFILSTINVTAPMYFVSAADKAKFDRLVRNVKKVYPYAKMAGVKLREYNDILAMASSDGERRKIMKKAEKEIKDQFGDELKQLTFSQGKILIKLLYRETGNSSYELVQELRGKFVAFFYQTFARLFGYNLKMTYDPLGEDKPIEIIVNMIEKGLI